MIYKIEDIKKLVDPRYTLTGKVIQLDRTVKWEIICSLCSNDEYTKNNLCEGLFYATSSDMKRNRLTCRCSPCYRRTESQTIYEINKRIKKDFLPLRFVRFVGKYKGTKTKCILSCSHHGEQILNTAKFIGKEAPVCPGCKGHNQKVIYLMEIDKPGDKCYKYGITVRPLKRLWETNDYCLYPVKLISLFQFDTVEKCKATEKICKTSSIPVALSQKELSKGFTETFKEKFLEDFLKIMLDYGVKQDILITT